ncbi:MAG: ATP-dependent DNA helicase [Sulfolobales archaeon]
MSELFPYERFREGQKESIESILKKYREGVKHVLFRAPTGFGKTSVAIASMMTDPPVIHSVRTRNEIQPVLRDLKILYERKRRSFSYSFIFSAHKMCPLLRRENTDPEDFWIGCQILRALGRCEYYNNLKKISEDEVLMKISEDVIPEVVVQRISRELETCPFFALSKLARESSYVVVTYPYALDPELFSLVFEDRDLSDYSLVLDEAHILTIPSRVYSDDFRIRDLKRSLDEIRRFYGGLEYLEGFLRKLIEIASKRSEANRVRIIRRDEIGFDESLIEALEDVALDIKKRIFTELLESRGAGEAISRRVHISRVASVLSMLRDSRYEMFVEYDRSGDHVIRVSAVEYSVIADVLGRYKRTLAMSGTPPSVEFLIKLIGLNSVSEVNALDFSSWNPQDSMAVLVTSELSSKYELRGDMIYRAYAEYIEVVRRLIPDIKMIVYPSYDFMRNILKHIRSDSEKDLVETQEITLGEFLERISKEKDIIMHVVAGGKIAEGVEFIENSSSLIKAVFIAGVPYPQPDDYIEELIRRGSKRLEAREFREYVLNNEAYIRTAQALGRAVRSPRDRALAVLGDRRFLSARLRSLLGLRRFRIVKNLNEFRDAVDLVSKEFL